MEKPLLNVPIAFDLDGTLVDTAPDLVKALNESVRTAGLEEISIDDVRHMVGRGAKALIQRAFDSQDRQLNKADLETHLIHFLEVYESGIADLSRPFEGVVESLETLGANGARLSVCTNKPGHLSRLLLEKLDMSHHFDRIIGADDTPAKKPDAKHLLTAIARLNGRQSILVGDSEPDYLAASNAGAGSVLFTQGYSEKPVHTLGADRLFEDFNELPALILELVEERRVLS